MVRRSVQRMIWADDAGQKGEAGQSSLEGQRTTMRWCLMRISGDPLRNPGFGWRFVALPGLTCTAVQSSRKGAALRVSGKVRRLSVALPPKIDVSASGTGQPARAT